MRADAAPELLWLFLTRFEYSFFADKSGFERLQGLHVTAYEGKSSPGLGIWGRGGGSVYVLTRKNSDRGQSF